MEKYYDVLETCRLFRGIRRENFSDMLLCLEAKVKAYAKNEAVLLEGERASFVGIVLSGGVRVVKEDYFGRSSAVAFIQPSQLFAEVFACAGVESIPVSVFAEEESEIMLIDLKRIVTSCSSSCEFHGSLIHNMLFVMANKNLQLNRKIELLSKRTTKEKLMSFLLAEAKRSDSESFTVQMNRRQLADYLGVERSAMSTELGKLKNEGKITFKKNSFRVLSDEGYTL